MVAQTPTKSTGTPQTQDPKLPTVKDKASGEPEITIPDVDAPTTTTAEVIKQGDGATIAEGDTALVQYKGVLYKGGKEFDSSWSKGAPTTFTISNGGLIPGFVKGLVGQKIGSQVMIVVTPEDGYGANPQRGPASRRTQPSCSSWTSSRRAERSLATRSRWHPCGCHPLPRSAERQRDTLTTVTGRDQLIVTPAL